MYLQLPISYQQNNFPIANKRQLKIMPNICYSTKMSIEEKPQRFFAGTKIQKSKTKQKIQDFFFKGEEMQNLEVKNQNNLIEEVKLQNNLIKEEKDNLIMKEDNIKLSKRSINILRTFNGRSHEWFSPSTEDKKVQEDLVGSSPTQETQKDSTTLVKAATSEVTHSNEMVQQKEAEIEQQALGLVASQWRTKNVSNLTLDSELNAHGLDSLDSVEFAMRIEDELDYQVPDDHLDLFYTPRHIATYIKQIENFKFHNDLNSQHLFRIKIVGNAE